MTKQKEGKFMMKEKSIQIQSVLYCNNKNDVLKAIDSLSRAIELNFFYNGILKEFILKYGDASPSPIFEDVEIKELNEKYKFLKIDYYFFGFNSGTSKGHNLLGKDCSYEYMMIMNPDVILTPKFFIEIMKPFIKPSNMTGMVEARQTPIEHPKEYDIHTGETDWAATACAVFPTSIFNELKGFDEVSFYMYCDDLDFSWRIRLLKYKIIYQPSAVIFHSKYLSNSGTWLPTSSEQYFSAEAALILAHKWSNPKLLKKLISIYSLSNNENLIKAVTEFKKRKENNSLVPPIDPYHTVAKFVEYNYTKHRFSL